MGQLAPFVLGAAAAGYLGYRLTTGLRAARLERDGRYDGLHPSVSGCSGCASR